jgi:hypothetical protein
MQHAGPFIAGRIKSSYNIHLLMEEDDDDDVTTTTSGEEQQMGAGVATTTTSSGEDQQMGAAATTSGEERQMDAGRNRTTTTASDYTLTIRKHLRNACMVLIFTLKYVELNVLTFVEN